MELKRVLAALEAAGTAQNRKVYRRHGVSDPLYGVSYATQGRLAKQNMHDTRLAIGLWDSGNHDARVLASMIADPRQIRSSRLDEWVRDLNSYVLTDAFSDLVGHSPFAKTKMRRWTRSSKEFVSAAGWNVLARLARQDPELTDKELEGYLATIEAEIHCRKNRARHSMNSALIAIGIRNTKLERKALAAAGRIGKVEVDHGETSCKTPDASAYIKKAVARTRITTQAD
jgi:3-methyladenine DNA glycosylase AlkD